MILLYSLWAGLCWVLRGGAISNFVSFTKGCTTCTRLFTMLLMTIPLMILLFFTNPAQFTFLLQFKLFLFTHNYFHYLIFLFPIVMWGQLAITGWGSYMQMGGNTNPDNEKLRPIVELFGINRSNWKYDFIGMTLTGLYMTILPGLFLFLLGLNPLWLLTFMLIGPIYLAMKFLSIMFPWMNQESKYLPKIFTGYTSYAEFFTGLFAIGPGLFLACV